MQTQLLGLKLVHIMGLLDIPPDEEDGEEVEPGHLGTVDLVWAILVGAKPMTG